jgi:hypothetical protein
MTQDIDLTQNTDTKLQVIDTKIQDPALNSINELLLNLNISGYFIVVSFC